MEKGTQLYEGKAKKIFATDDPQKVVVYYKDDATAFNAQKKGQVANKGILNNKITSTLFRYLSAQSIPNHFIEILNEREQLCTRLDIFKLEFIVRNIITGSMAKRVGIKDGTVPSNTIFEICYKNDDFGDPLINDHHAVAMNLATYEELKYLYAQVSKINTLLQEIFLQENIILVDFKVEFGKDAQGNILLADEITPDTCRLWDKDTMQKLDKDRFREDLGGVEQAYLEILNRLSHHTNS